MKGREPSVRRRGARPGTDPEAGGPADSTDRSDRAPSGPHEAAADRDGPAVGGADEGPAGGDGPVARDGGRRFTLARIRRLLGGIPAFGRLLYRLLGDSRVSLLDRAIFGAALVYLFVPLDLVPDWVPAFGQVDDLLVVVFTLDRLLYRTDEAVLAEHWDGDPASLSALRGLLERAAAMLPGWARRLLRAG